MRYAMTIAGITVMTATAMDNNSNDSSNKVIAIDSNNTTN